VYIHKTKRDHDGNLQQYKARWVVECYLQEEGIDYSKTFAVVVRSTTYKLMFALVLCTIVSVTTLMFWC